jgi:hypothetical protein
MSFLYLASPYSHKDPQVVNTRFLLAERVTAELLKTERFVYSPIVHCHEIARKFNLPTDAAFWMNYNKAMLAEASDLLILCLPGWQESVGVNMEIDFAKSFGMFVSYLTVEQEPFNIIESATEPK